MLFVLVIAVLMALLYSTTFYVLTSKKIMSDQGRYLAMDGLIQTLAVASNTVDAALATGMDDESVIGTLGQPLPGDDGASVLIPFIIDNINFNFSNATNLPGELPQKLVTSYTAGDFETRRLPSSHRSAIIKQIQVDGRIWLTASVQLEEDGRYFGFARNITVIVSGSQAIEKILAGSQALTYLIFFSLLLLILKIVTTPLKKLTEAAMRYARGNFSHRVNIQTGIAEIGVLRDAFNQMGSELERQRTSLEKYSKRLEESNRNSKGLVDKLSRRQREQKLMLEASIEANRLKLPTEVFNNLMRHLYEDLELEYITFFLPELSGTFRLESSFGLRNPDLLILDSKRVDCMLTTLKTMEPQRVHVEGNISKIDITNESVANPVSDYFRVYERLYIPISMGDNKVGILELNAGPGNEFDNATIRHLRHFVSHMEVILRNKALYQVTVRRSRELERINMISRTIAGELDLDVLIRDVVDFIQKTIPSTCSYIGLLRGTKIEIHHISPGTAQLDDWIVDISDDEHLAELSDGNSIIQNDLNADRRRKKGGFIETNVFRSFVGCPIKRQNEVVGVICGFSTQPGAFSRSDLNFLELLAGQVAIAMQNAIMLEDILARDSRRDYQLSMAQKLQENRVPKYFKQNVVAVHSKLQAADELAGDFCDVFSLGRNSMALIIGDVANKGVAASLMTFSLLSMFRNVAKTLKPPCEIMESINRSLLTQVKEDGWFATGFYGRLNTKNGVLTYSSAGHEQPVWYHNETGKAERLEVVGYPLGLFKSFPYETREIQLKQGDRIILYTDGVTDANDSEGNRFGHERLLDLIENIGNLPAEELTENIINAVMEFASGKKQRDDIIICVAELQDDPWIHKLVRFPESGEVIDEVLEVLTSYDIDKQTTYSIRLALDEAFANAWRHGLNQSNDVQFQVSYYISDDGFRLSVMDPGTGFDSESLPDPTVEENLFKSHGRGVFLIRQMMDEVEFNETGNEISVYKRFATPPDDEEACFDSLLLEQIIDLNKQRESLEDAKRARDEILSNFESDDD